MAESVDIDFLNEMNTKAKCLAENLNSQDHWAKPFYSDVHTFKPGIRRVFIGLNGKGDKCSRKYDNQQQNEQRIWSGNKPFHNAYLDERWGGKSTGLEQKGQSPLQVATQRVFKAMYGETWKTKLRSTPCFNLVPVSSNGTSDSVLGEVWEDGVKWGIKLIDYLRPRSIILYGNSETGKSVWAELQKKFCSTNNSKIPLQPQTHLLKICRLKLQEKPSRRVPVIALPHLSWVKEGENLDFLCAKLGQLAESHKFL